MNILNLTQHSATPEQVADGVIDLTGESLEELIECLTFDEYPDETEILARVESITTLAACWQDMVDADSAMIGGAPWLTAPLTRGLQRKGIRPLFAYTKRVSSEVATPDGGVRKVSTFKHLGFIPAVDYKPAHLF